MQLMELEDALVDAGEKPDANRRGGSVVPLKLQSKNGLVDVVVEPLVLDRRRETRDQVLCQVFQIQGPLPVVPEGEEVLHCEYRSGHLHCNIHFGNWFLKSRAPAANNVERFWWAWHDANVGSVQLLLLLLRSDLREEVAIPKRFLFRFAFVLTHTFIELFQLPPNKLKRPL